MSDESFRLARSPNEPVVALVMILTDQMWKKLPSDHPAVYCEPALDG